MYKKILIVIIFCSSRLFALSVDEYFEKIRGNQAELTAFISQMPKGGDLHHHYSGSVYAETYLNFVVQNNYYINQTSLAVKSTLEPTDSGFVTFSQLSSYQLYLIKEKLLQKWSVKDYNGVSYPCDKQFFETFDNFSPAVAKTFDAGLLEIKRRAKLENVSYIETMFTTIPSAVDTNGFGQSNLILLDAQSHKDTIKLRAAFNKLFMKVSKDTGLVNSVQRFNNFVEDTHQRLALDDSAFTLRFQNFIVRVIDRPAVVFKNLVAAFESADKSDLIVGVNIVAPEDNEISMRDYWLHMQMFKYCREKYPNVKYSMHAGELTLGLVKPEELTWHIGAAVYTAKANRIGHGVDIAFEQKPYDLLNYMSDNQIPIEINLFSNEFILKVKEDNHPFMLYKKFGVPILICTDDAGVLRTNLIEQYVLLAMRYKDVRYSDIKSYAMNSIKYSFIESDTLKDRLLKDLENRFADFENVVMKNDK